jgi:hypothetical protein
MTSPPGRPTLWRTVPEPSGHSWGEWACPPSLQPSTDQLMLGGGGGGGGGGVSLDSFGMTVQLGRRCKGGAVAAMVEYHLR